MHSRGLGEATRAVRLFGAAEALRETPGAAVAFGHTPEEAAWREPRRARALSLLGKEAWEEALAEGRAMGLREAIDYALSEQGEHGPPAPLVGPDQRLRPANWLRGSPPVSGRSRFSSAGV